MAIFDPAGFAAIIGPVISVDAARAIGPTQARYETDFVTYADRLWQIEGAAWEGNYYDRAFIYYTQYLRDGNPEHLERANAIAVSYRDEYVLAAEDGIATWWSMPKGIAAHYFMTGDPLSLAAIGDMADTLAAPWHQENNWENLFDPAYSEGREIARVLEGLTVAIITNAPSDGVPRIQPNGEDWGPPGGQDYRALAQSLVERILWDVPDPDGSYPRLASGPGLTGTPGVDKPFMNGLINEALINYYEQVSPDPRILGMIKANLDYMWANEWDSATLSFQYIDEGTEEDGVNTTPSPDMNGLIVNAFGWVYAQTGDPLYRERGDLVFQGSVEGAWLDGSKQFNQAYNSLNYLGYVYDDSAPLPPPPPPPPITGTSGNDHLIGTSAGEAIAGLGGNDLLEGREGGDFLDGGAGNDTLRGGPGGDVLYGGVGRDVLNGGADADVFLFKSVAEIGRGLTRDVINSFQAVDLIDFRTIDTFTFDGSAFDGAPGSLRAVKDASGFIVAGDVNGDKIAEFALDVNTFLSALTRDDFIL